MESIRKRKETRFITNNDKILRAYICYAGDIIFSGGMDKKFKFWNMKNRIKWTEIGLVVIQLKKIVMTLLKFKF